MTVALTLSVLYWEYSRIRGCPVSDLPGVDYPVIQVQVAYPGATPETMANNVAAPLERQFMQVPGDGDVEQWARALQLRAAVRISRRALMGRRRTCRRQSRGQPRNCPLICQSAYIYETNPETISRFSTWCWWRSATEGQLYDYANTQVGEHISILPGVSQVAVYGTQSAVRIKADPSAMAMRNISLEDLTTAIKNGTSYTGAGQLDRPRRRSCCGARAVSARRNRSEQLIVGQNNGSPVYLKDVATAKQGVQDGRVDMRFWARGYPTPGATVVVAVYRRAGANAVEVTKAVRELLPSIRASFRRR